MSCDPHQVPALGQQIQGQDDDSHQKRNASEIGCERDASIVAEAKISAQTRNIGVNQTKGLRSQTGSLKRAFVSVIKSNSTPINSLSHPIKIKQDQTKQQQLELDAKLGNKLAELESKWLNEKLKDTHIKLDVAHDFDQDVDCGYAWIILATIFVINASTYGTARAYGLIFDKLARASDQTRSEAALPFTIMGAVENMGGPFASYMLTKTGSWRTTVFLGCSLITTSHFIAAFVDNLWGQVLVMGLMCGLGLSLVTMSFFQINNSYFVRYRSRAFGLGLTGAVFGTMYISPVCQFVLEEYGVRGCYLVLAVILLPNVPISLLLRPKSSSSDTSMATSSSQRVLIGHEKTPTPTVSARVEQEKAEKKVALITQIKMVIEKPIFHLIWPTQMLFCWLNFVYGMIIVDFGKDRGLDNAHVSQLNTIWALGQLIGRVVLGSLVDIKLISYEMFAVVCFASIGLITYLLNNVRDDTYEQFILPILVVLLSMFIANLYILFNSLTMKHMDKSLSALSIGISSFTSSFFLLPRASVIGYYRDTTGNYDTMLSLITGTAFLAALVWSLVPLFRATGLSERIKLFGESSSEIAESVKRLPSSCL